MSARKKCVLAYSGGLDTSVMIPWLNERGYEVHCLAGDVGQGAGELDGLEEKAAATGAASCKVVDLRDEFLTECVWPTLRALAVYEGRYLLGTSMARPVLARAQALHALELGAEAVAHGCTGKGNDQVRFELGYMAFAPALEVVAPWRNWEITSREDALDYAAKHGIPVAASRSKIYSRDRNLWHISHEGGELEDPGNVPSDEVWTWTISPKAAPDEAARVKVGFERGVPVALDDAPLGAVPLLERLNELGAAHGVGRIDITENRLVGMKSRGVYETPGGTILYEALRTLRSLTMERDTRAAGRGARGRVREARLQRPVVPPGARGPRRVLRGGDADLHRRGDGRAVQRQRDLARRDERAVLVQRGPGVLRDGRHVRAGGFRGLPSSSSACRPRSSRSGGRPGSRPERGAAVDDTKHGAPAGGDAAAQSQRTGPAQSRSPGQAPSAAPGRAPDEAPGPALWGGRFEGGLDPAFESFNRSLPFDQRLVQEDLRGSGAWARALGRAGVLEDGEVTALVGALEELAGELAQDASPLVSSRAEDVHAFVEDALGRRVGTLARKLHTGRSRNDQVATDLKLWLDAALARLDAAAQELARALAQLAAETAGLVMPGYTHLQRAQPITAGHHALAYVEMLARDRARIAELWARASTCPLGSAALAGVAFPVDREALAEDLGFARATRNSLDAVSDRDHVAETLFACTLLLTHLSRLAEDWIFFMSAEAGFLGLADDVTTGSSLMPQKKNPDALELVRGKAGRVLGHLTGFLATYKALPLAYDKDLQEDKEPLFDALDTATACVKVMASCVRGARFDAEACRRACRDGYLDATDLADLLVSYGVPFRDAHERVGACVRAALMEECPLVELSDAELGRLLPELAPEGATGAEAIDTIRAQLAEELSLERILDRRASLGGTAPARVREAASEWLARLAAEEAP